MRRLSDIILIQVLLVATTFVASSAGVSSDQCRDQQSDTTFLPEDHQWTIVNSGGYPIVNDFHVPLYITRVVGPRTADQFNADGTLKVPNWSTYTAQGVLSAKAYLSIHLSVPPSRTSLRTPGISLSDDLGQRPRRHNHNLGWRANGFC